MAKHTRWKGHWTFRLWFDLWTGLPWIQFYVWERVADEEPTAGSTVPLAAGLHRSVRPTPTEDQGGTSWLLALAWVGLAAVCVVTMLAHTPIAVMHEAPVASAANAQARIDALRLRVRVQEKLAELRARQAAPEPPALPWPPAQRDTDPPPRPWY